MPFQERREPLVPKAPPALLHWLWPDRYPKPQDTTNTNPAPASEDITPQPRVDSNNSVLSTDSYLAELKPIDAKFRQLCEDVLILDTCKNILQSRKHLSHEIKKRQRLPFHLPWRRNWTADMDRDYKVYKAKVDQAIPLAKKQADKARKLVGESSRRGEDMALQEMKLCHAMDYHQVWFDTAIDAAQARIEFMHKYCPQGCFTPKGDKGHLIAAQSNLNSAKKAVRELEQNRKELRKLRMKRDQEASRWGSFYIQQRQGHILPSTSWHGDENGNNSSYRAGWAYCASRTN